MSLPSFLSPLARLHPTKFPCLNAVFHHESLHGDAHALWWPTLSGKQPDTVLFFVPGNPGLVDFYLDFFTEIQQQCKLDNLAVFAHAHLGHTAGLPFTRCDFSVQVDSALEALDALVASFPQAKVILIAHSMGCWISLQLLKQRADRLTGLIFMTPTIRHIRDTPNGRKVAWLFHPFPRTIITNLTFLGRFLPISVLRLFQWDWPPHQLQTLKSLVGSSEAVRACLVTSHDEMTMILDLDIELMNAHAERLRMFFAGEDGWVGSHRDYIISRFTGPSDHLCLANDVPHSFPINHSAQAAEPCIRWIRELLDL